MKALWVDEPQWLRACAHPGLFVVACAWLFVLVCLGTLAQADIGLYQAQDRYFSSWFLWLWHVPLPGGRLALSVTGFNLLATMFTRRGSRSQGIFLLHGGMLLLLGGGLVGGALRQEGSIALAQGERGQEMNSWRHRELTVFVGNRQITFGEQLLRPGAALVHPEMPQALIVDSVLINCRPGEGGQLMPLPSEREVEQNQLGVVLRLPSGQKLNVAESSSEVTAAGMTCQLGRATQVMPFALELIQFKRENHPGTGMARWYSSEVIVHTDNGDRRKLITMNDPLREGPWTVYQQSYAVTSQGEISVLAVVHDRFQLSPYLSSAVMCLGLLMHLWERLRRKEDSA